MVCAHLVAKATPGVDFAQYLGWYLVYARSPLEVMAHMQGIELAPIEIPAPTPTRHTPAFDSLVASLTGDPPKDELFAYRLDSASRVAEYLRLADTIGPALEAQDLAEVTALLGARPESFQEADEKLEAFVLAAGPEQDEALIRYFHRRMLRQEATLKPAMRELEHARVQLV
jgi:hypothetical protein